MEKAKLTTDSKIEGDITADDLQTRKIKYQRKYKFNEVTLGGVSKGNVNSDEVRIKSTAEVDGVLNQKNLSIEEGAKLKIKAETF